MARIVRRWSRLTVPAALGLSAIAAAVAFGAAPARGTARGTATAPAARGAATRPVVTAANRQAANTQFQKALQLYNDGKHADAKTENDKALLLDPTHEDALRLRIVIADRLAAAGAAGGTAAGGTVASGAAAGKPKVLTNQQISTIRLMEMRSEDRNINGSIPRQVREDFWNTVIVKDSNADLSQAAHNNFLRPDNFLDPALRIRESGNPKFIEGVVVNTDPAALAEFKTNINTYVLQNCATAACHGSEKGGDFRILTARDNPSVYTNFYVMTSYNARTGGRVIDRDNPERSLFIQYSIPRQQAAFTHPGEGVAHNKLSGTQDARYQTFVNWVRTLTLPKPNYNISLEVGGAPATPPPATPPATPPARGR
jgi:hypothetical protein